jgi:hypothetical protein
MKIASARAPTTNDTEATSNVWRWFSRAWSHEGAVEFEWTRDSIGQSKLLISNDLQQNIVSLEIMQNADEC